MQPFAHRGISLSLAGWLWADLLLGLFAIFLAANAVAPATAARQHGIDPKPIEMRIEVSGVALLSGDPALMGTEQRRVADLVREKLATDAAGRHVAIVFAYGAHERASEGDRMAAIATELLRDGPFSGTVIKSYHELVPGDPGTSVALEIYVDE